MKTDYSFANGLATRAAARHMISCHHEAEKARHSMTVSDEDLRWEQCKALLQHNLDLIEAERNEAEAKQKKPAKPMYTKPEFREGLFDGFFIGGVLTAIFLGLMALL